MTTTSAVSATTTTSTTTTTAPVPHQPTASLTTAGGPFTAPALVTLSWTVADADGDTLTCYLDRNNDGTFEDSISPCPATGSRNVSVASAGSASARLLVDDGSTTPVSVTVTYSVGSGTSEPFNITIRNLSGVSGAALTAFSDAAAQWESMITRGTSGVAANTISADACGDGEAAYPSAVDDILINIDVVSIDGAGGILGQAGPCLISGSDGLPRVGIVQFDSADVTTMLNNGTFGDVVLHEMGHTLGYGTVWNFGSRDLVPAAGGVDPRFTGPRAVAEWLQLGGSGLVPVENSGGSGTADAHWREVTFGNEVLTGYITGSVRPLSAMSIASMADLGYQVDITQADAYSLPSLWSYLRGMSVAGPTGVMERPPMQTIG